MISSVRVLKITAEHTESLVECERNGKWPAHMFTQLERYI